VIQKNLIKALVGLTFFVIFMAALGFWFEPELIRITTWIVDRIGFLGMALLLLVTDTLVTPFPPDILLIIIANSPLAENWPFYVGVLGLVSVVAGMTGYGIGRWLGHFLWVQKLFSQFSEEHRDFIQKYGFWAVVIGAITPLPYSLTCWTAGVLGLRWSTVLTASLLFRIPRFFVIYWLIANASNLFSFTLI
jgi:membrane protein YqaA with SNARE-associated domain